MFANYLIRKRGHNVVYLGQNVPLDDLIEIERIRPSDYMLTSFITSITDCNLMGYLYQLQDKYPEKKIFVTGLQAEQLSQDFSKNVKFLNSPEALISELDHISS
jgi:hypothetical protein